MKWYRTNKYDFKIEEFEVIKHTDKTVTYIENYKEHWNDGTIKERKSRENINSSYYDWHETKNLAQNFLLNRIDRDVKYAKETISRLQMEREKLLNQ